MTLVKFDYFVKSVKPFKIFFSKTQSKDDERKVDFSFLVTHQPYAIENLSPFIRSKAFKENKISVACNESSISLQEGEHVIGFM